MALDYGTRHIGVAVGESITGTASPMGFIENKSGTPDWERLSTWLREWNPQAFIIGLPLTDNRTESQLHSHIKGFAKRLKKNYAIPVFFIDEAYTSIAAQEEIRRMRRDGQMTRRAKHTDTDAVAAAIIMESWFKQQFAVNTSN